MLEQPRYSQLLPRPNWDKGLGNGPERSESGPVIDFGYIAKVVRRRALLILAFLGLALVAAAAYVAFTPPVYSAATRILFEDQKVDPFKQDSVFTDDSLNSAELDGQLQVVRSRDILGRVVDRLRLTEDPDFMANQTPLSRSVSQGIAAFLLQYPFFAENFPWLAPRSGLEAKAGDRERAIDAINSDLSVRRVALTNVIELDYDGASPRLVAEIVNGVAKTYIEDRLAQRMAEAQQASAWFDSRMAELRQKAIDADAEIARFRSSNGIVEAGREGLLSEQQLSSLSAQLADAGLAVQQAQARLTRIGEIVAAGSVDAPITDIQNSPLLGDLRAEYVDLSVQHEQSERLYGAEQAATQDLANRMAQLEARIKAELTRLQSIYQGDYELAVAQESQLRARLDELVAQSGAVGESQIRLRALESEAAVYRALYDDYLQRYQQTLQQQSFPNAGARVIAEATAPDFKTGPSARFAFTIALAVGAAAGLGAAFVRERMDRSIRTSWQLRLASGVPTLGLLPALPPPNGKDRPSLQLPLHAESTRVDLPAYRQLDISDPRYCVVMDDPYSRFAETLRRVKVVADTTNRSRPCDFLGFISAEPLESRGMVAANFAQLLSSGGRRTLLVDLDFRAHKLTRALAPQAFAGLVDLAVTGAATHAETTIWCDDRSKLHFLPAKGVEDASDIDAGVLDHDRIVMILGELAASYDCIVLDLPPLSLAADALAFSNLVHGYVLVAEWGVSTGDDVAASLSASGISPDKIFGTVLSEVDLAKFQKYERLA